MRHTDILKDYYTRVSILSKIPYNFRSFESSKLFQSHACMHYYAII